MDEYEVVRKYRLKIFVPFIRYVYHYFILILEKTIMISYYNQFLSSFSIQHSEIPPAGKSQLIEFIYPLLSPIFNVYLVISTTRRHKFNDRAIKLAFSLKFIIISFIPLLSPKLVHMITLGLISFAFGIFMLLQYTMLVLLGCNMNYNSVYFLVFIVRIAAFLAGLLIYFGA